MYMFIYVNVFGVPVPQPSSVSVYLRVRIKSTVYVNPRLLIPGSPVHRDKHLDQSDTFSLDLTNQLVIRLTNNHRPLTQYTCWVPVCL